MNVGNGRSWMDYRGENYKKRLEEFLNGARRDFPNSWLLRTLEEQLSNRSIPENVPISNPYSRMVYNAIAPNTYYQFFPTQSDHEPTHEDPNPNSRQMFEMLNYSNMPLYYGCKNHTRMSVIGRLIKLKTEFHLSERWFDEVCKLVKEVIPEQNTMINNLYDTKKQLSTLGLPVENIDCCPNGCIIYWRVNANANCCHICETSRWRKNKNGDKVSRKQFHYFPLSPRLQRLYASAATAGHMRWHAEHHTEDGEMSHPSDAEAWLNFNATHSHFAKETRNVRLGLYTDGFNPFGNSGQQYSSWPVIVTPYNLPPWMCMKKPYMFLTVLVPGPCNPKHNIDLYLQPLIHELNLLWEEGIRTYDVSKRENFQLRAALLWTISDLPAFSMLSGRSLTGVHACPYCMDDSEAFYLTHSRMVCWFGCHKRFLDKSHPYRKNKTGFRSDIDEQKDPPPIPTGYELLNELDQYGFLRVHEEDAIKHNKEVSKYSVGWKKRSIFWDLPYWKSNIIRHNLDVMDIEKNVFNNIFNTILCVSNKTKDHVRARHDLHELDIRSELHPLGASIPKASYTLNDQQINILLQWLKDIKFPDGYMSNISKNIDMAKHQLFAMKSYDCHVFMQRLVPIMFRELLPLKVWEALTELSLFFTSLTTTKLNVDGMRKLEKDIPIILCKLETIFPPTIFDIMQHLSIHLAYEARIAGPVQYRWIYPFERYLRHLNLNVKNKAHVESSICNAYLAEETSHFVSHYFEPHIHRISDFPRNVDESCNNNGTDLWSIFTHPINFHGKSRVRILDEIDYKIAHRYVLMNCRGTYQRVIELRRGLQRHYPNWSSQKIETHLHDIFADMFKAAAQKGYFNNFEDSSILKQLAKGPLKETQSYNICYVNGYRFQTIYDASNEAVDFSGVCIKAADNSPNKDDLYGQLQEIIVVEYPGSPVKRVTLFKCHWYDPTTIGNGRGTKVHERYKLVDIHHGRSYRKYDPFVLASQASQVYYLPYPSTRQNSIDWRAVCKIKPRKFDNATQHEPVESALQEENGGHITIAEDIVHVPLRDPSGALSQQVDDLDIQDQDDDEDVDVDLVLSEDGEEEDDVVVAENDDYYSDEGPHFKRHRKNK